jgi:hypothetical protein
MPMRPGSSRRPRRDSSSPVSAHPPPAGLCPRRRELRLSFDRRSTGWQCSSQCLSHRRSVAGPWLECAEAGQRASVARAARVWTSRALRVRSRRQAQRRSDSEAVRTMTTSASPGRYAVGSAPTTTPSAPAPMGPDPQHRRRRHRTRSRSRHRPTPGRRRLHHAQHPRRQHQPAHHRRRRTHRQLARHPLTVRILAHETAGACDGGRTVFTFIGRTLGSSAHRRPRTVEPRAARRTGARSRARQPAAAVVADVACEYGTETLATGPRSGRLAGTAQ